MAQVSFVMSFQEVTKYPIIIDTGASLAITPFQSEFFDTIIPPASDLPLDGIANGLKIPGIGLVQWSFTDIEGNATPVESMAYYVRIPTVRLLSPQWLFDLPGGDKG